MAIIRVFFIVVYILLFYSGNVYAAWSGPTTVLSGGWGDGSSEFGIENEDYSDMIPSLSGITPDSKILIFDIVQNKKKVFNPDGTLYKEVMPVLVSDTGRRKKYRFMEYSVGRIAVFKQDGNILTSIKTNCVLRDAIGNDIDDNRPIQECGQIIYQGRSKDVNWIVYLDKIYYVSGNYSHFTRELNDQLNAFSHGKVTKYDQCGKVLGSLSVPEDKVFELNMGAGKEPDYYVHDGYGIDFYVDKDGNAYNWHRTEEKFEILKWIWQDDANVDTGPDLPEAVQAVPSTSGIYLTWNPSPQDPGCVTGYDIERATSATGVFSNVTTVPLDEKQTYSYNDTGATAGATWYYRIRAASDIGNSDPVEVSATRP